MDTGNTNAIPDYSALRIIWTSKIQSIKEVIKQCEIGLNRQESIHSLVTSTFIKLVSHKVILEGSALIKMREDFEETRVLMEKVTKLLKSMKKAKGQAQDELEFISSHISQRDCRSEMQEIQNLIDMLDTMSSLIFETLHQLNNALTGIEEQVYALVETYSSSDLDE
ncbi:hypothetical protein TNCT_36561 [Trichonephila clavata]|uniref:Uncharacterized protein n=1 Tax=Trichonephila clavata TaxID=2740835 RepID=A0A8X6I1N6_TRICU|nr:hypothetical protein TNCT_36561 [Trichonephila clavata]